jgi:hypothetical protein
MSYRRFLVPEISSGPATLATFATLSRTERESVATVVTVARGKPETDAEAEFEERAALVEYGAGVPRDWAEGFARLDRSAPPPGFSPKRWQQVVNDGGLFLDRWAAAAARLGWSAEDVFGVHPTAPGARYDCMGLVPLIGGGTVVSITTDRATIRQASGATLVYLRRPRLGAIALWKLEVCEQ